MISQFASTELLALLETSDIIGAWQWTFASNEHSWSLGMFRLLGLEPKVFTPSYERLLAMVHPEDRTSFATVADVLQGTPPGQHTARVIRPDGSVRILSCRGEVYLEPCGRPRAAAGVVLDTTDKERLAHARIKENQHRQALFIHFQTWMHSSRYTRNHRVGSSELLSLKGISQDEFQDDWTLTLLEEDRNYMRDHVREQIELGKPFSVRTRFLLAEGGHGHFRGLFAPVRDASGSITCWATITSRADGPALVPSDDLQQGLEQAVEASHVRAARGLLDWSMEQLAVASGLSLSTVRRLEDGGEGVVSRSRHKAIAALRQAGIRFIMLNNGKIAVTKI